MSAYQVSKPTIQALVAFLRAHSHQLHREIRCAGVIYGHVADDSTWLEIGRILWDANADSVCYRYNITREAEGIEPWTEADLEATLSHPRKAVEILKMVACVEYQSCEIPEWEATAAHALLRRIEREAIAALPGYDAAPWGLPEPSHA